MHEKCECNVLPKASDVTRRASVCSNAERETHQLVQTATVDEARFRQLVQIPFQKPNTTEPYLAKVEPYAVSAVE